MELRSTDAEKAPGEVPGAVPGEAIASATTDLGAAARLFVRFGSSRSMAIGFVTALTVRFIAATAVGWSLRDVVAVAIVVSLVPFVEWFIHLVVLHSRPRTVRGFRIDPGIGHREHHANPATVHWVLLRGIDATIFQVSNAVVVLVVVGGPLWLFDVVFGSGASVGGVVGPVLTGVIVAVAGLAHYEWSHFLFHTAYRPKTAYYRRLKANHRLHHWRNERYWLGITTNLGDRVLRTYPASRSAVPISPTAKTLGVDPET